MKHKIQFLIFIITFVSVNHNVKGSGDYFPPNGFIPNAEVAVKVAEAILSPIYGDEKIKNERPFIALKQNDKWIVRGSLHKKKWWQWWLGEQSGGVAEIEISQPNGEILRISHGK